MRKTLFFILTIISFSSVLAQKTITGNQNPSLIVYDEQSITFTNGTHIKATSQSKFHAYIDKVYTKDPLNFNYDISGNQIKRYLNITITSIPKTSSPNMTSFDKIEIVQESIKEIETIFQVYPNPTQGPLNIKWNTTEGVQDIQLYNLAGQEVKNYQVNKLSNNIEMNISNVPSGIYVLRFITTKGEVISRKIIKK
ncbi:T9SS type A sorting domain-containing protein [Empedobacter sp. UBA7248]|uniref:T9SS type A sorting domain-containing protein n=1 Tax=Empedobacter sp. UBA7248 TaxID=1946448 RepID=UPI0025BE088C|nr:T9SS type A sorting domain-containing protein [Empedobacter sp. UBA7248]